jgi:hypothetical protein
MIEDSAAILTFSTVQSFEWQIPTVRMSSETKNVCPLVTFEISAAMESAAVGDVHTVEVNCRISLSVRRPRWIDRDGAELNSRLMLLGSPALGSMRAARISISGTARSPRVR